MTSALKSPITVSAGASASSAAGLGLTGTVIATDVSDRGVPDGGLSGFVVGRSFLSRCDRRRSLAPFWLCYVAPMTRVERAASTTSSVMVLISLMARMRSI